jgi:hypothetical protein
MADRKGTLALVIVAAPLVLMLAGGIYLLVNHFVVAAGKGKVHVLAPPGGPLKVQIDKEPTVDVAAGDARAFAVAQGVHEVALTDAEGETTHHHVEVKDGFFDDLLPTTKQCFAVVDVSHYVYRSKHPLENEVADLELQTRLTHHKPAHLVEGTYLRLEDAPETIDPTKPLRLVIELPCKLLTDGDDDDVTGAVAKRLPSWRDVEDAAR